MAFHTEGKRKILSDAAGAGCPLRSAQWSFIVLLSSMMRQGRRQWRISEQRHMSGSESVDRSVLERQGVIVMGLRAADTQPRTLHGSTHTQRRGQIVSIKMSGDSPHTPLFIHNTWHSPADYWWLLVFTTTVWKTPLHPISTYLVSITYEVYLNIDCDVGKLAIACSEMSLWPLPAPTFL